MTTILSVKWQVRLRGRTESLKTLMEEGILVLAKYGEEHVAEESNSPATFYFRVLKRIYNAYPQFHKKERLQIAPILAHLGRAQSECEDAKRYFSWCIFETLDMLTFLSSLATTDEILSVFPDSGLSAETSIEAATKTYYWLEKQWSATPPTPGICLSWAEAHAWTAAKVKSRDALRRRFPDQEICRRLAKYAYANGCAEPLKSIPPWSVTFPEFGVSL